MQEVQHSSLIMYVPLFSLIPWDFVSLVLPLFPKMKQAKGNGNSIPFSRAARDNERKKLESANGDANRARGQTLLISRRHLFHRTSILSTSALIFNLERTSYEWTNEYMKSIPNLVNRTRNLN